jgi:hypothetical protein
MTGRVGPHFAPIILRTQSVRSRECLSVSDICANRNQRPAKEQMNTPAKERPVRACNTQINAQTDILTYSYAYIYLWRTKIAVAETEF